MKLDRYNILGARLNGKDIYSVSFENYKLFPPERFRLTYTSTGTVPQPITFNSDFIFSDSVVLNQGTVTRTIKSDYYPTSMQFTYEGAYSYDSFNLISIDELFGTENLTTGEDMLQGQAKLLRVNVDDVDFSNLTSMQTMFSGCQRLLSVDGRNWRTLSVSDMYALFSGCINLESLDATNWDTSQVYNMSKMFYNCKSLRRLDLSSFDTSRVTDFSQMFVFNSTNSLNAYRGLEYLDIRNFNITTANVTNMFYNTVPTILRLDNCDTLTLKRILVDSKLLLKGDGSSYYTNSYPSTKIYCKLSNIGDTPAPTGSTMHFVDVDDAPAYRDIGNQLYANLIEPELIVYKGNKDCSYLSRNIYDSDRIEEFKNLSLWNTSNVTNMTAMFKDCESVKELKFDSFDFNTFSYSFDTSKVLTMQSMFENCTSLEHLDLSMFNTSSLKDIRYLCYNCKSLKSLNLSGWDLSGVVSAGQSGSGGTYYYAQLFAYCCPNLSSLYLYGCNSQTLECIVSVINSMNKNLSLPDYHYCGTGNGTIYCDKYAASGLTAPKGWTFNFSRQ